MSVNSTEFLKLVSNPIKFKLFLLRKLPSAFFAGLQLKFMSPSVAIVAVPYKWFTQNPFRSTYFACLAMAAEMCTGLLAMNSIFKSDPPVSMLVKGLEASYFKKAVGLTSFTCRDGEAITACIASAISTGVAQEIKVMASGVNTKGELVATFFITWSFKVKV